MYKYQVKRVIGRGNYGTAFLARDKKNGSKVVIKKIPLLALSEKERRDADSECKLLAKLRHPNIVEYIDSFIEEETLHLVTQYCERGDLSNLIKESKKNGTFFSEKQIVDWFIQIAMAVDHIHSLNIMHRDLKTGNVFLTKTNVIKLGDFGIAKVLDSTLEQANTVVGTPYYMSPEVCENKEYDKKSDLWAMGCILYELCTLNHAFDASNLLGLVFKIVQESYPPIPDHYSEELRELVNKLLSKNPSRRPSCRRIFRMPFIKRRLEEFAKTSTLEEEQRNKPLVEKIVSVGSAIPPPPPTIPSSHLSSLLSEKGERYDGSKDYDQLRRNNFSASRSMADCIPQNHLSPAAFTDQGTLENSTPIAKVRERRDAANRKREEELKQAAKQSREARIEARRRSEQFFQPSAENHLLFDSPSHDTASWDHTLAFADTIVDGHQSVSTVAGCSPRISTRSRADTAGVDTPTHSRQTFLGAGTLRPRSNSTNSAKLAQNEECLSHNPHRPKTQVGAQDDMPKKEGYAPSKSSSLRCRTNPKEHLEHENDKSPLPDSRGSNKRTVEYSSGLTMRLLSPFDSNAGDDTYSDDFESDDENVDNDDVSAFFEATSLSGVNSISQANSYGLTQNVSQGGSSESTESNAQRSCSSTEPSKSWESIPKSQQPSSFEYKKEEPPIRCNANGSSGLEHDERTVGPNWDQIAKKQRKQLVQTLGKELFDKVYSFLKMLHSSKQNHTLQENQYRLRQIVGSEKLKFCFDVDQLIYIEETMLA